MADEVDLAQECEALFLQKALEARRVAESRRESLEDCEVCGDEIPERRRQALPGVRTCLSCQSRLESRR